MSRGLASHAGGRRRAGGSTAVAPTDAPRALLVIALLGLPMLVRLLYLGAQPGADPTHALPAQDGAFYLDWAEAILSGEGTPAGAFYLAPLFPYLLALSLAAGVGLTGLYVAQHLLALATALCIAFGTREQLGGRAALLAAALFLLHHPLVFFYSRPLGEPLALFLLVAAVVTVMRPGARSAVGAGLLLGAATLARPNLLLVLLAWLLLSSVAREWRRALLLALGCTVLLAPVTLRNALHSGHLVPVSSNAGITAYHGNGPGARGIYTAPAGFSGALARQREEATALARLHSGTELDDVEADRWWGAQARAARRAEPLATVALLTRRFALLLDNYEYGLDAHPMIDRNPWRPTLRFPKQRELALVPFAALLGLSVAGALRRGREGSGGRWVWSAIVACAATPLLFYVSSRYRLPFSALLAIPAGCGLDLLLRDGRARAGRAGPLAVGLAVMLTSLLIGWFDPADLGELRRRGQGEALANRAVAFQRRGDLGAAEQDARRGAELAPGSARARFNLGVILDAVGRKAEAEQAYVVSLELSGGGLAESAANLSKIYLDRGDSALAVRLLTRALESRPTHEGCWTNLIVALVLDERPADAREAVRRAVQFGVALDAGLVALVEGNRAGGERAGDEQR